MQSIIIIIPSGFDNLIVIFEENAQQCFHKMIFFYKLIFIQLAEFGYPINRNNIFL